MEYSLTTPHLKLTLITEAQRGSQELEWIRTLLSDKQATFWSFHGQVKTIEDAENRANSLIPINDGSEKRYRVVYAVHKILDQERESSLDGQQAQPTAPAHPKTEFIGLVNLKPLEPGHLPLPEEVTLPVDPTKLESTLTVEIAYSFLPAAWGKGFATEAVKATLEACKQALTFWAPFKHVNVRSVVGEGNNASLRVMDKSGMVRSGIYHWRGEPFFIAGTWRHEDRLTIYNLRLIE